MNIETRVENLVKRFSQYKDWEDRYRELIKIGKEQEDLAEEFQIEKFQIKGCQSKVWLKPEYREGRVFFTASSDAVLVKGIVGILVEAYSDSTPDEVIAFKDDFLQAIGITDHLSMNRTNGLANMLKQIKMYGLVFKSLADKGIKDANNF